MKTPNKLKAIPKNEELIKQYLENGGEVTKCPNFNPGSDNNTIKVKGKVDQHSKNQRHLSSIKYQLENQK